MLQLNPKKIVFLKETEDVIPYTLCLLYESSKKAQHGIENVVYHTQRTENGHWHDRDKKMS
jgi:hypothetical protein